MTKVIKINTSKRISIFPLTPGVFLLITSIMCFLAWATGEQVLSNFGIRGWRFNSEYMIKSQGLILVFYFSYMVGKSQFLENGEKRPFKSKDWDFFRVHQLGKKITFLGLAAHGIWFTYSLLVVGTEIGRKLATIPGITTLTQVLPVGICCMYLAQKKNVSLGFGKYLGFSILVLTFRTFLNSERLALLELFIPLSVIYLYFEPTKKLNVKFRLISTATIGSYFLFFILEFFRSWQFYRNRWQGSYFSFINDRIGLYYLSSWNNGVVYAQYWKEGTSGNREFFRIFSEFPLVQTLLTNSISESSKFGKWFGTLNSTLGTAEFNNPNYLIVTFTDLSYFGALIWFVLLGVVIGKLIKEIQRNNLMALIAYACTAIALADLPRVGWWTSTRSVPVYLMLVIIHFSKLEKEQNDISELK